jgi:hypothetical protein
MRRRPAPILAAALLAFACRPAEPPPRYEMLELRGSDYERGFAHGEQYASKIRSIYTQLLTTSLLPALGRERPQIAEVLTVYQDEYYDDFAYEVLLESAEHLEATIPERYLEEMRGIADGAGLPYGEILILNTFIDTVLGVRTVQRYLDQFSAPKLTRVEVVGGEAADPYAPSPHAHFVDVPTSATLRLVIEDAAGVDPATVRLNLDGTLYTEGDAGLTLNPLDADGTELEVLLAPPGGLPAAAAVQLGVEAGNLQLITDPPPTRARFMRPQWLVFATEGHGAEAHEVPNLASDDPRFPPPPIAFAASGDATPDGALRVAHHFSLLDAGSAHKHVVVLVHRPDDGLPHVTVGWTGIVGGFAGMNADGLVWTVNHSDTLDNPVVGEVRRDLLGARLLSSGFPITMLGRDVLTRASNVDEAADILVAARSTVGWNHLVAGEGGLRAVEADGDILGRNDRADHVYGPDAEDDLGRPLASVGGHDLRIASHFQHNTEDIQTQVLTFEIPPQRFWSPFWHRSLRVFHRLGEEIDAHYGALDADTAMEILRTPGLYDPRDSMKAMIFEPEHLRLWLAAGTVPATDAPFELHELADVLEGNR